MNKNEKSGIMLPIALDNAVSPSELIADFEETSILPSFVDIRNKTLDLLYQGGGVDKSPKGSVDVLIQPLVDLLNQHPSFTTLSSCSGRIALFDSGQTATVEVTVDDNEEGNLEERVKTSGKGQGVWLLASHDIVQDNVLIQLLDSSLSSSTMVFKHEPLLLHVAACNLERGRQLLTLALGLGFRESGLVVTETRVTVAIRGYSLAITMPLAREGALRPSDEYLVALTQQANYRMRQNQVKLIQLFHHVKETLFQKVIPSTLSQQGDTRLHVSVEKLPPLNLWGHAAVLLPSTDEVYVFGGYGSGPFPQDKRCTRSSQVYRISRENGGDWSAMEQVGLNEGDMNNTRTTWYDVDVVLTNFAPCEGLQAIILPMKGDKGYVVAIWGGRASPTKPFGDLLLYEPTIRTDSFTTPIHVKGDIPEARWGHTLTALSGQHGQLALLIGGRTEYASLASSYVLSLVDGENGKRHFLWTKLDLSIPQQFHHTTLVTENDLIIVFGGLSDPNDLLESFSDSYRSFGSLGGNAKLQRHKSCKASFPVSAFQIRSDGTCQVVSLKTDTPCVAHYGGSGCVLTVDGITVLGFTGGMPFTNSFMIPEAEPLRWFSLVSVDGDHVLFQLDVEYDDGMDDVNFGALVHHSCLSRSGSTGGAMLLGGGISSFAFGASFAEYVSYHKLSVCG